MIICFSHVAEMPSTANNCPKKELIYSLFKLLDFKSPVTWSMIAHLNE